MNLDGDRPASVRGRGRSKVSDRGFRQGACSGDENRQPGGWRSGDPGKAARRSRGREPCGQGKCENSVVDEIRMLRLRRRGLETESRTTLNGHEGGIPGTAKRRPTGHGASPNPTTPRFSNQIRRDNGIRSTRYRIPREGVRGRGSIHQARWHVLHR